ncbi:MAG: hypothetical protein A2042_00545 [Candidatus Schekmanbacteria bacterium GWA2_38_11]|uniref:Microcin J25-processing protein McjB C-terminal domain-containing protein n=1 Tax=Candidatus Schekmanbacteria bacterium GWA2_38_11 TaxID=1817876 RepID=A0A1F7RAH5_9BACT|nr:MAG: hypothetical protein A2042_00545 [Candidatus Schekmanbacteria bacterium GWA2_38_11]
MTLFFKIGLLVIALPVMTKVFTLPKLMKVLTPGKRKETFAQDEIDHIIKITDLILNQRFFIFHPTCLKKSLVLYHFLNKHGLKVVMNFGVKKDKKSDKLDGHGWLTLDDKPFLESYNPLDFFKVVYSYPKKSS